MKVIIMENLCTELFLQILQVNSYSCYLKINVYAVVGLGTSKQLIINEKELNVVQPLFLCHAQYQFN